MEIVKPTNALITSLVKSLDEIDKHWRDYEGIIITGSWPGEDDKEFVFEAMSIAKEAMEKGTPLLGICLGHQVVALNNGHTLEKLPERRLGIHKVKGWWGETMESFWHDYTVGFDWYKEGKIITVAFHPEYQSSKDKPHRVLKEFLDICKNKK